MIWENVESSILQNLTVMAAILRRPMRLFSIVAGVAFVYILIIFVPKHQDTSLYSFQYVKSSFDWSTLPQRHPVKQLTPLPKGLVNKLPKVQHDFSSDPKPSSERTEVLNERRLEVKDAFSKSWNSYKRHAWMWDELTPVTGQAKDGFGGWAASLVDSLDTLWIMGLKDEFYEATAAAMTIDWSKTDETACNFFETTIRHLGGLLSAYDLSKERAVLQKAIELGDMLYSAFDTPNRMPPFWLDFEHAKEGTLQPGVHDPSASVASSSLEFTRLAQLTGEDKYYDAIDRVTRLLDRTQSSTQLPGMWPTFLDMQTGNFDGIADFTLGALADSLYEYLPKMHALLGGLEPVYEKMYREAMDTVIKNILFRPMLPDQDDILFSGSSYVSSTSGPQLNSEGQHLACFVGGMFGLGSKLFNIPEHLEIGEKLARGCAWAYDSFPTGIGPEIFGLISCPTLDPCPWEDEIWKVEGDRTLTKGFTHARDQRYLLRPEAIESIFLMYRMTGNQEYQEIAWKMFQSIKNSTETDLAFSAIAAVTETGETEKLDSMESFWMSETLKYFYLIFSSPELINLDDYVLNTEAHPFKRP
ncbi:endoplasmic reticulum mannosyl-oligosaccharide 1,2-alpha-mannosidase [Pseudomassariella vexata]|uniref:alpha-1,2-Mannosidase n=1 Tax=Pseudomassariella vexata TaxID=1141098 RepID=A0A1Y2DD51_9PEZI|nr:endoplasmic reticulum mannosyl-oligosaccharide 1,2-alpha-mannosidase [Pseudomassariella vexata]ORY57213.1 endoplasmic reticulum mannosyl-oligosaccharide 1,2-alpha-mannosidase [Pseudomassariella vexata]